MDLKYLTLSDIHLGHKKTHTSDILANLDTYFDQFRASSQFTDLDLIFIAGDLFDSLLDFSSPDIHEITLWLSRLVGFCSRHDIKLRILEGTPSHDWKQSKIINTIMGVLAGKTDVKYIDTLYIERISDLDLTVLYVPDEWTSNTDLTYQQVEELLVENGLTGVDIAMMHGCFGYQVANIPVTLQHHDEDRYLAIVKYFINIGHFHCFSTYSRVIAQGSFDRISHGEEDPKGAVVCYIGENPRFEFIENTGAKIYRTINVRYRDIEQALVSLDKQIINYPNDSYIRIKAGAGHPLYTAIDQLKLKYPQFNFSKVTEASSDTKYQLLDPSELTDFKPINITPDNIVTLIMDEVKSNYKFSDVEFKSLTDILREVQNKI